MTKERENEKIINSQLIDREIHLWLGPSGPFCFDECDQLLDQDRLRLEQMGSEKRRGEFFSGRSLLYKALSFYMGPDWKLHTEIQFNPRGKPFLKGDPLYFSLSHTVGKVGLAVSTQGPVGLDLEKVRDIDIGPLALRVLGACELRNLDRLIDPIHQRDYFFWKWTEREAKGKQSGEGLQHIESSPGVKGSLGQELQAVSYFLNEGYYLSLAYPRSCPMERLRFLASSTSVGK